MRRFTNSHYSQAYSYNHEYYPPKLADPKAKLDKWTLRFTPYAWSKLLFMRDIGDTEVAGFGIGLEDDPLFIHDIKMVQQDAYRAYVTMTKEGVRDYVNRMVADGLTDFNQFFRVWVHTHPMESPHPSGTDESTFAETFANQTWSVMCIVGRTGDTYASLQFRPSSGLRFRNLLSTYVDFSSAAGLVGEQQEVWKAEYEKYVNKPSHDSRWSRGTFYTPSHYQQSATRPRYGAEPSGGYTGYAPYNSRPLIERVYGVADSAKDKEQEKAENDNQPMLVDRGVQFEDASDNDKSDQDRRWQRKEIERIAASLSVSYDEVAKVYSPGDDEMDVLDALIADDAIQDNPELKSTAELKAESFESDLAVIRKDNDLLTSKSRRRRRRRR